MNYTIKQLADLSGVSVRTLRFYDEIGLFKSAYVGENQYRYYQKEQLLLLQQILFFKELGFELKHIETILKQPGFDQLKTLHAHTKVIKAKIERLKTMSQSIKKTIAHIEGTLSMTEKEMYWGHSKKKQKEYENYLIKQHGSTAQKLIAESHKNTNDWSRKQWDDYKEKSETLYTSFVSAIEQNLKPDSDSVQTLTQQHYKLICLFYKPTKEVYISLGEMYVNSPEFREKWFNPRHPKLAKFVAQSMNIFAQREL